VEFVEMPQFVQFLRTAFPDMSDEAYIHYSELLSLYQKSAFAPPHLMQELETGSQEKSWSCIWEAMLFRYLQCLDVEMAPKKVTKKGQDGPDFCVSYQGLTIWIEAISPAPKGIPEDWLSRPIGDGEPRVRSMPHEEMLLRWTSALSDKKAKFERYLEKGIVASTDAIIIAINSSQLYDFAIDDHGISQLPFAVEAVFPIGPLAIPIDSGSNIAGPATRLPRYFINKSSGTKVPTGYFLQSDYSLVSAVIGTSRNHMFDSSLPLTLVHNPKAAVPLPKRLFKAAKEFVASKQGDQYLLQILE
jgi:type I restriction enzyme S subunit